MGNAQQRAVAAVFALLLCGCTGSAAQSSDTQPPPSPQSTAFSSEDDPTLSPSNSPKTPTDPAPTPLVPDGDTSTDPAVPNGGDSAPVPKVQRSDAPSLPNVSAPPVGIEEKLAYDDGVVLRIDDILFGEETKEGPGRFPGRGFAVLELVIINGGTQPIDLNTTVVTVIDAEDQLVAPVYVEEADVADFSGDVQPGKSSKARYAFAVANKSRSQVIVVVDFDGVHTSAVFRGELR